MSNWTLQTAIRKLLIIQGIISLLPLVAFLIFGEEQLLAMFSGGMLACLITIYKWLAFRRQPVVEGKKFYWLIIRLEIMKFLLVIVGTYLLANLQLPPLGVVVGFSLTYLMYFFTNLRVNLWRDKVVKK